MIIYATKQTIERYKLKLPHEFTSEMKIPAEAILKKEGGNSIHEWGAKLFYFDGRKCIQIVHFASKFTLFLIDIKVVNTDDIGNIIAHYLLELYKTDKRMKKALKRMFKKNPLVCFSKLTDRSIIATLNSTQRYFLEDGDILYDYIDNGIMHTMKLNYNINFKYLMKMKIDGKMEYIYAGEKFREVILNKFDK